MIGGKKAFALVIALAFMSVALTGCLGTSEQSGGNAGVVISVKKATNWSSSNPYPVQPQEGNRYVLLEMSIKNNLKDELAMNPLYFKLDSSDGQVHTYSPWVNYTMADGVQAGSTISATLGFELSKAASPTGLRFDNIFQQANATVPAVSGNTVSEQTSNSSSSNQISDSGSSTNTPSQGPGSSTPTPAPAPTPTPVQCDKPWPSLIEITQIPATTSTGSTITIQCHMTVTNYNEYCQKEGPWNAINTDIRWKLVSPQASWATPDSGWLVIPQVTYETTTMTNDPYGIATLTYTIPLNYGHPYTAMPGPIGQWTVYAYFDGNPNYIQTVAIGYFTVTA